jgi:acyl carrier protein
MNSPMNLSGNASGKTSSAVDCRSVVFEVLRPLAAEKEIELKDATELAMDLDLDSMRVMELLLELEDRLDVSIPQNILPELQTLADLVREVEGLFDA